MRAARLLPVTLVALCLLALGTTTTTPDGSYNFTKSFGSFRYAYVYARVEATGGPACPSKSAQPGGCASTSTDGRASDAEKILSS